MLSFRGTLLAIVCLGFTATGRAWADPAQVDYVEDPYADHVTRGTTARVGTAVGFVYGERIDAVAIGGTTAFGQRFGRLTIEAELAMLALEGRNAGPHLGDAERLGVLARYDVLRLGPRWVGGNSLFSIYVEGGAAVAWNHWYQPAANEEPRIVPGDTKRVEGQAGVGVMLEHRLQEPVSFPKRIGWYLGWRVALAPHQSDPATVCRGVVCDRV
ncbi:MAG: hypothetical protein ABIY55_29855, partial [Kofleriaceae bacterium]